MKRDMCMNHVGRWNLVSDLRIKTPIVRGSRRRCTSRSTSWPKQGAKMKPMSPCASTATSVGASSLTQAFEVGARGDETMIPVPIDYFKVLGLGNRRHASKDEIERAYANCILAYTLPSSSEKVNASNAGNILGSPFSTKAIASRRHVLDLARHALTSRSPGRNRMRIKNGSGQSFLRPTHESVSLPVSWISGALMLCVESGDFENCVAIGTHLLKKVPLFTRPRDPGQPKVRLNAQQRRDVSLAVALSHCELAKFFLESSPSRRSGLKRRVAEGCAHLNAALITLRDAPGNPSLMPSLCDEIESALEKLVAPCALDHLRLPLDDEHKETRSRAIEVVKDLLLEESAPEDGARSSINAAFVEDVFNAMTSLEISTFLPWKALAMKVLDSPDDRKYTWFEPKILYRAGAAKLLNAYIYKKPQLIKQALEIFTILQRSVTVGSVDLVIEIAVAMVFLGKVDTAIEILEEAEASGDSEISELEQMQKDGFSKGLPNKSSMVMTFIRFAAKSNSPQQVISNADLLDGICAFTEKWIETRASPLFRDTSNEKMDVDLISYFDDPHVRQYAATFDGTWKDKWIGSMKVSVVGAVETLKDFWVAVSGAAKVNATIPSATESSSTPDSLDNGVMQEETSASDENMLWKVGSFVAENRMIISTSLILSILWFSKGPSSFKKPQNLSVTSSTKLNSKASLPSKGEVGKLLRQWQKMKSRALGNAYDIDGLVESLSGPMVKSWKEKSLQAKNSGYFWTYDLKDLKVLRVEGQPASGGNQQFRTCARITETAQLIQGRKTVRSSYSTPYKVNYTFQKMDDGTWKITKIELAK